MRDAENLVEKAVADTGLDDFGPGAWRDGLDVLVDALEGEAHLNALGNAMFEDRLGNALRQRLHVHDWRRRHPEIGAVPVEGPLIVLGLPRTGTTVLSNLLGCDPATRAPRVWESATPCPPPDRHRSDPDPRIAATQAGLDMLHELKPVMRVIHDDEPLSVAEHMDLLALSFRAYQYTGMAAVPSYLDWWLGADQTDAYVWHRMVIQLLGWRWPPNRWHLRNPPDLFWLEAVVAVYPDARFVWCHRDPARVLASVCELVAEIRELASDSVGRTAIGAEQLHDWGTAMDRALVARERLGEERFVDVSHADVVADPVAAMAEVYERVGWPFGDEAEQAARTWLAGHGRTAHGEHRPCLTDYGIDAADVRERLDAYCRRFGL